jgi:hypothetical protein
MTLNWKGGGIHCGTQQQPNLKGKLNERILSFHRYIHFVLCFFFFIYWICTKYSDLTALDGYKQKFISAQAMMWRTNSC